MKISRRKFLVLLGAFLAIPVLDFTIVEPGLILVKSRVEVKLRKRLENSFRIVQISDLHFGSSNKLIYGKVLASIKELRPNLISITGDIVSKAEYKEEALRFIEKLRSIAPTFIVWGNWDHWSLGSMLKNFKEEIESLGEVKVLVNENIELDRDVYLAGVDDPYIGYDNLDEALQGTFGTRILMAHSPQIIGKAVGSVDLILSGHTHGGQVVLPFIGPLYIPLPKVFRKYVSGMFKVENTVLYVSRGIGTSILPIRLNCPPEIVEYIITGD